MKFSRRNILVVVIFAVLTGLGLAVMTPCVRVGPEVVDKVKPGMTLKEVEHIIGGPPGWYDGVCGVRSNEPVVYKNEGPSWLNARGEIIVHEDDFHKVTGARFREVEIINWDVGQLIWERTTRGIFRRLETPFIEMVYGALLALILIAPVAGFLLPWWRGYITRGFGTVAIIGTCISIAFVLTGVMTISLGGLSLSGLFIGAGGMGLILFSLGGLSLILFRKTRKLSSLSPN